MKYFAVWLFDNSAAAQNHGVWAVKPSTTRAMHTVLMPWVPKAR